MSHSFENMPALAGPMAAEAAQYPTPGYPDRDQLINTGHVAIVGTDHEAMLAVHDALAVCGIAGYSVLSIPEEPATDPRTVAGNTQRDFRHVATAEAGKAVADVLKRARIKAEANGEPIPERITMPGRDVIDPDAIVAYRIATQEGVYMSAVIEGAAAVVVTDVPSVKDDELSRVEALIGWAEQHYKRVSRLRPGVPISPTHLADLTARVRYYEPVAADREYGFFLFDWLATRRRELRVARASQRDGKEEDRRDLAVGETTFMGTIRETFNRRFHRRSPGDEHTVKHSREDNAGRILG